MNSCEKVRTRQTIAILTLIAAVHGVFIARLGYFWDDWMILLVREKLTDSAFFPYYAVDRPTSAWVNFLFYWIPAENPIAWHLLACLFLFTIAVLFQKLLDTLWETSKTANFATVLIFIATPLFSQTYIAITYAQHNIQYILFLSSLLTTIQAVRTERFLPKLGWTFLSLCLMVLELSVTEYFATLEFIRVIILWIILSHDDPNAKIRNRILKTLQNAAPYGVILTLFFLYRLNFERWFPIQEADTAGIIDLLRNSPMQGIATALKLSFTTAAYPFFNFVGSLFTLEFPRFFEKSRLLFAGIAGFLGMMTFSVLRNEPKKETPPLRNERFERTAFALMYLLLGILPFIIILSDIFNPEDPAHIDRTYYVAVPAVAMIFEIIIRGFVERQRARRIVIALFIALATYQHMILNDNARIMSKRQQSFYRQLKARVPAVQDNTAFISEEVLFPEQGSSFTAAAINILYPNPFTIQDEAPLWVYAVRDQTFEASPGFATVKRIFRFTAAKDNAIFLDYGNPFANCLWVFRPEDIDHPHISEVQRSWIERTAQNRIQPVVPSLVDSPDSKFFGEENPNAWCSLYHRAAFASQFGDYELLETVTDTALEAGFRPSVHASNSPYEWIPFLESLYAQGRKELADELRDEALSIDPAYREMYENRFQ